MYLQDILEVVLGLIFTWLVLSIATMQIQEWLAGNWGIRGNYLYDAIKKMLGNIDLADMFYAHPIINSLSDFQEGKKRKPSYISAENFAKALLSIISSASTESWLALLQLHGLRRKLGKIKSRAIRLHAEPAMDRLFEMARLAVSAETGKPFGNLILVTLEKELAEFGDQFVELKGDVQELLKWIHTKKDQIDQLAGKSLVDKSNPESRNLLLGILALRVVNPALNLALNSLLVGADDFEQGGGNLLQSTQVQIEKWFNDTMQRLSGWYKRRTQIITFGIGLILAISLNIDSIYLSNYLWREPTLRQAIMAQINANALPMNDSAPQDLTGSIIFIQQELAGLSLPIGWSFANAPIPPECRFAPSPADSFGIPWRGGCIRPVNTSAATNGWAWLFTAFAGWLMSAFAASQGSSFWFDILTRIINVRNTGSKPQG